jgi:thioredoxin 1
MVNLAAKLEGVYETATEVAMTIHQLVDSEFEKQVLRAATPVLLAFRASWCLPSQQLVPIIDEIANQFENRVRCFAVDMEANTKKICQKHKVNRLPVTMLFDEGRCVDFIGGFTSKDIIVSMIERRLDPIIEVDEFNFDVEVVKSKRPVLVHFDAEWCKPSRDLVSVVNEIAQKFGSQAKVARVEFGKNTARLCSQWNVVRVPTLALFVNGQIKDQILGGMVGGTKVANVETSCVALTSFDNISSMLQQAISKRSERTAS